MALILKSIFNQMELFLIILLGLFKGFAGETGDDPVYYAKITNTWTYMNISRENTTEYWFAKDKYCRVSNQVKTIIRKDIGVIYYINLRSNTLRTDSIKPQQETASVEKETRFKYIGLNYVPVYEWNVPQLLSPDPVGDFICEHFSCEGDADFDQISLEFLIAKTDDLFMADMLNTTILNLSGSNNKREPVIDMITKNKNLITLRIIETVENSIAPHITTRINVDKLEPLKSAEEVFELTDGLKKIN